jgi:hypothetical protein
MTTLLITIATSQQSVDLEVPGDVPIGELLPALVVACGLSRTATADATTQWTLGPASGGPFPPNRSLIACGVVDGASLTLQDAATPRRASEYFAVKPTFI